MHKKYTSFEVPIVHESHQEQNVYDNMYITLLTLIATLYLQGESPTYILNEDTQPVIRATGVSHTACKYEFRQIFCLTAGLYFHFLSYVPDQTVSDNSHRIHRFRVAPQLNSPVS